MTKPEGPKPTRIVPKGDLLASRAEVEREAMLKVIQKAKTDVVLDISKVQHIDSMGISLIVGLYNSCRAKGLGFSVEGASKDILQLFKMFSLSKYFQATGA